MNIKPGEYKLIIFDNGDHAIYNSNNNLIHFKDSTGYEKSYEYDSNNNLIHTKEEYNRIDSARN